jgi:TPR repeat protein
MIRRLLLAAILLTAQAMAAEQGSAPSSEDVQTRPDRQEIIDLMIKSNRAPAQQRSERLNQLLGQSESKTPRSDFLFCTGLAYLGDYKAQICVAKAYEAGRGVVEDGIEAYVWYSIAAAKDQKLEAEQERMKNKLQTAYPFPSDDDLEAQLNAQQSRIKQYQADMKKQK